jgi:hypothetical protein
MSDPETEKSHTPDKPQSTMIEDVSKKQVEDQYHMNNELAFKGDDSDGHVQWTTKSIIAAMSLGGLYAGNYQPFTHLVDESDSK